VEKEPIGYATADSNEPEKLCQVGVGFA